MAEKVSWERATWVALVFDFQEPPFLNRNKKMNEKLLKEGSQVKTATKETTDFLFI